LTLGDSDIFVNTEFISLKKLIENAWT